MNSFSEHNGGLPQFAELTSRPNSLPDSSYIATSAHLLGTQQSPIYTTSTSADSSKQSTMVNNSNKYPGTLLAWPNPNTLMQLCEKQALQTINIPNYSQNNPLIGASSNNLPVRLLPNMYLPTTSQSDTVTIKLEDNSKSNGDSTNIMIDSHVNLQQQNAMAEYIQKLQATSLPLTLQQLIKLQSDPIQKKEKLEDEHKIEQTQNNILNIPSVPNFRNNNIQTNGNHQYINTTDQLMQPDLNPVDLNVHIEQSSQINVANVSQPVSKVEQQLQTDSPKTERKVKFRAKTGEIKIAMGLDGSMLYCCPECSLAFPEKLDIEQHIQGHVQERKYQCKECGAMLKRKEHLDQHMRGHSDERPFKCPVCQKAFKRNEHLTRHYVIHSGDKNFTCNVCQKAFSRKDHLNKHTQTHLGIKRAKTKKETIGNEIKESVESLGDVTKQELSYLLNGNTIKQDPTFLQHIQNLQKDQNFSHTFAAFKEQSIKSENSNSGSGSGIPHQQQAVNMNEILPQNMRYLMPS